MAPDVLINASAYTAVDKAEHDQVQAELVNHHAVENIANACKEIGCWFIHISTDYVFDGTSVSAYSEDDKPNPQGVYGHTKLSGELAIKSSGCSHVIIRTGWVYSEYGNNFFKTMLRLGAKRNEIDVVGDQVGCPTYAQDLARAVVCLIPALQNDPSLGGLYHYSGNEPCTCLTSPEKFSRGEVFGIESS